MVQRFKSFSPALQAILIAILAFGSYSHADVLTKFLTQTYSPSTCLCATSLIGLSICVPWIFLSNGWKRLRGHHLRLHLIRGLIISISATMAVTSIHLLPLPEFYSIVFLGPIFLLITLALLGHEKLVRHRVITVIVAFLGVLIIVGPQYQTLGIGLLTASVCVVCSSAGVILARKIGHKDRLPVYAFFPFASILLLHAPFAQWDMPMPDPVDLARFLGVGLLITVGHIGIPIAYSRTPEASLVAPVFYTQMLWGVLYGMIFFDRLPTPMTAAGATLIIGSGLYMMHKERRRRRSPIHHMEVERD